MNATQNIPSDAALEPHLIKFLESCDGAYGALVVTDDGYVISHHLRKQVPAKTLAAMTSSLLGLSESVAHESGISSCNDVMVEGAEGTFVAKRIDDSRILAAMANKGTKIGMLLSASRNCIDSINLQMI
jgi:predicted regulator of Ras-like GTPase activity (Roadblock/LC7/MglB family)